MKYTTKIEIRRSLNRVIELFDSTENMYKWQPGLVSFEHISGKPGEEGCRSRLKYRLSD